MQALAADRSGRPVGGDPSALAERLGVSTADLRSAMEETRPEPGRAPSGDPAQALADVLGLDVDDVRAAMDEVRPAVGPTGS